MAGPIISKLLTDFFNEIGPEPTSRDVRCLVAIEGKADVPLTSPRIDFDPNARADVVASCLLSLF